MSAEEPPPSVGFPGPVGHQGTGVYKTARLREEIGEYELSRMRRIAKNEAYVKPTRESQIPRRGNPRPPTHFLSNPPPPRARSYLDKLGLGRAGASTINMIAASKKSVSAGRRVKRAARVARGQERRSNRVAGRDGGLVEIAQGVADRDVRAVEQGTGVGAGGGDEEYWGAMDEDQIKLRGADTRVRLEEDYEMTEAQKKELEGSMGASYLSKFQEFLVYYDRVSDANCRSVMKQVHKLARGEGITYGGWREGVYFKQGVKVSEEAGRREEAGPPNGGGPAPDLRSRPPLTLPSRSLRSRPSPTSSSSWWRRR